MEETIKRKDWDEIRPKTIFSGNGNGLKNCTFLSTREQKNVHTVDVKQDCMCVCRVGGGGGVKMNAVTSSFMQHQR